MQNNHKLSNSWLIAKKVSFQIASTVLVNNVDLSINSGEFIAILGPNGAGKSTLLKLLTGFLTPTQGEITLNSHKLGDHSLTQLAQLRAVMQQHILMPMDFKVIDVILLGKTQNTIPNSAALNDLNPSLDTLDNSLSEIIALTECGPLLDRHMLSLSGGEQQRVHLARTLYQIWGVEKHPVGIFLDEPTSALDLYYQQHLLRLLQNIAKTKNMAICAILHDVNLAALYADRMIILNNGAIEIEGTPEEVLLNPNFFKCYRLEGGITYHAEHNHIPQIFLKK